MIASPVPSEIYDRFNMLLMIELGGLVQKTEKRYWFIFYGEFAAVFCRLVKKRQVFAWCKSSPLDSSSVCA